MATQLEVQNWLDWLIREPWLDCPNDRVQQKAQDIRLAIFDVDGVLTQGHLYLGDDGQEYKAFYARDGLGINLLQTWGIPVGIITGRSSPTVTLRMRSLGITHVFQGQLDKYQAFKQLCQQFPIIPQQVAYMGDDLNDLSVMAEVGLSAAVGDAHPLVISRADWQSRFPGGCGAVREFCELLIRTQHQLRLGKI